MHTVISLTADEYVIGSQLRETVMKQKQKWIEVEVDKKLHELKRTLENEAANLLTVSKLELEEVLLLEEEKKYELIGNNMFLDALSFF
jgi:hypothetical protein